MTRPHIHINSLTTWARFIAKVGRTEFNVQPQSTRAHFIERVYTHAFIAKCEIDFLQRIFL